MKIVSSGKVLNSREFYEKKKRRRRIQLVLLSIGFLSILSSLVYLSRLKQFLIIEVAIQGENVIDKEEITQTARRLLAGYYLWVIPRANTLIYPRRAINQSLIEKFPRLKSVNLNLGEQQKLLITVEERAPFALYCISDCFFLDEEGFIFANAPSFSSGVYFVYVTENPVLNPLGKRFITIEEFESLSRFKETLAMLGIESLALDVGDSEYRLTMLESGQIIWRRDSNLTLIKSNLEAFLSDNSIRAQENFLDRILYLDLRTENKVFYKFRD
ncbi:MAG: hypothetical protein UW76_C0035G0008 [Parcubacteria group bacterium GW2011_GWF2_44_8b]|nr:MAG: hypothetical protein UW76_C0035G0008 [Parcubacteria group bacterium GW2011_GWF2_44_8b]